MASAVEMLSSCFIVVGGVAPYVPQYIDIAKSRNSEGFSTLVCLILLVANILRILFWFGHPFETPLLIQSFLMNAVMLIMVQICVETRPSMVKRNFSVRDMNLDDFWKWTDFNSYLHFLAIFLSIVSLVTYALLDFHFYVEGLGLVALLTEAMLATPQLIHNWKVKSTAGMSIGMVVLWMVGDLAKTAYFIIRGAPNQFLVCGVTQITIDLLILLQVFAYKPQYRSV